jgi:hypothetical protein
MTEMPRAQRTHRQRRFVTFVVGLALAGSAMAVGASTAYASGVVPATGELCTAAENIQFFNDQGVTSYTVQTGEFIRVDQSFSGLSVADGHGTGHSTRHFIWIHSNGQSRVRDCH